jgi:PAS domain S-box-containing protein
VRRRSPEYEVLAFDGRQAAGVGLDISEHKRIEAALRESEQRFHSMADCAPVWIWMSGLDKGCNFFNETWLQFTRRSLVQEYGYGWAEGVHPDDLSRCVDIYNDSFDAQEAFEMEYRPRRYDGEYRWLLDKGRPRYDHESNFVGYIGSCTDSTEHVRMRDRLEAASEA